MLGRKTSPGPKAEAQADFQRPSESTSGPTWAACASDDPSSCFTQLEAHCPTSSFLPGSLCIYRPSPECLSCSPVRPSLNTNPSLPRCTLLLSLLTFSISFSSVQFSSVAQSCLFATPWTAAHQASLSITNSQSLPKLMSIELVMPSNHLILCFPLLLLPLIFPRIRVFPSGSALHIRWPKYWCFSFNISPSNEHSGAISFRMDWLDLLAVQGTLKSLFQYHSSKASIL